MQKYSFYLIYAISAICNFLLEVSRVVLVKCVKDEALYSRNLIRGDVLGGRGWWIAVLWRFMEIISV